MTSSLGKVSVVPTPVIRNAFGFLSVNVSWVVPPTAMAPGNVVRLTVMVGGAGTPAVTVRFC